MSATEIANMETLEAVWVLALLFAPWSIATTVYLWSRRK